MKDDLSQSPLMTEANALTEQAYDLKQHGQHKAALALLSRAAEKIVTATGNKSEAYASNLDDQATIYLRVGETTRARSLYTQAEGILLEMDGPASRLLAGIRRRKATMDAFERMGYRCQEPLQPKGSGPLAMDVSAVDGGVLNESILPYFPDPAKLQHAFGIFNSELKGCLDSFPGALPVWTVVTGDGRLALCSVKNEEIDTKTRDCLEKQLMEISRRHAEQLPRFTACFRNFTYPLAIRK